MSSARRSGASLDAIRSFALVLWLAGAAGCAGPLAMSFSSASLGTSADGTVRHPLTLPTEGDGYAVPEPWRSRHANYGTEPLVSAVTRAARAVEREAPGGLAAVGDLSHRTGGGSAQHKSHQDGRDVDIFYYAVDSARRPVRLTDAMLHFAPDGRAFRWSPPQGMRPPARPVPPLRFDARRNWTFVRALLTDPDTEVQWIFMQRSLGAALLAEAAAAGDDPALLARAAFIIHQPNDSEPHDDHMHIRLYCGPDDRRLGCTDKGPVRWWKKLWKYMAAPYGRAPDGPSADELAAWGRLIQEEAPPGLVGGKLTS
ncbi:MAG TPA: penicillin-insensitive murein endopeptidase [Polyangia bacterium]|nr:penicillin-insensitive murein endopeptidase [Polyangia bacterium]